MAAKRQRGLEDEVGEHTNNYPKLHNAMWPGVVGKGPGTGEDIIDFDTMLELTAKAEYEGQKFDGIDLWLADPHVSIDATDEELNAFVDKVRAKGLKIGSLVAPIWGGAGGGSAMGSDQDRAAFLRQVEKACILGKKMRDMGVRPTGVVRIDSSTGVADWLADPEGSKKIVETFRQAADIAAKYGERLAAEGEICWGGMQSWKHMLDVLEGVDRPNLGFQADMAHTLLYTLGYNSPETRLLPEDYDWQDQAVLVDGLKQMTAKLRDHTIDFHIAQNDATVKGQGDHDKTGRHCLATDPNGKLDITRDAGWWLRDADGNVTKKIRHVAWDGCMFTNETMLRQQTWNDILAAMVKVRDAHGWRE